MNLKPKIILNSQKVNLNLKKYLYQIYYGRVLLNLKRTTNFFNRTMKQCKKMYILKSKKIAIKILRKKTKEKLTKKHVTPPNRDQKHTAFATQLSTTKNKKTV